MPKTLCLVCVLMAVAAFSAAGCLKVDAKAPAGWGAPPPPASIPAASPNSKGDLLRENQQLRDRLAWLEDKNRHDSKEVKDREKEIDDIRRDMDKIAAERDRYRRAAH